MVDEAALKKCQKIQLGLLKEVDRVCKLRGWKYWLDGGTLLGAVRHKGFIPWDDDVDVAMLRKDFEEFRASGQQILDKNIFLQDYTTDKFDEFLFFKLRDKNSLIIEKKEAGIRVPYHQGIFLDVFPMDAVKRGMHKKILRLFKINNFLAFLGKCVFVPKEAGLKRRVAQVILFPLLILNLIFKDNYSYLLFVHRKIFNYYMKRYISEENGEKNAVYFKPFMCANFPRILFEKDDLFPLKTINFEDGIFPAPADIHKYLELQYGDYLRMPRSEKQVSHSFAIIPVLPPPPYITFLIVSKANGYIKFSCGNLRENRPQRRLLNRRNPSLTKGCYSLHAPCADSVITKEAC
jgi:lipopolysaccharide cholinephosphotransferase